MHRGQLRAVGTPTKLKSTVAPGATLEDVFRHYATEDLSSEMGASGTPESSGSFREIRSSRKVASRAS
jgi:ABC-2 type transport system ATP-binding protein